MRSHPDSGSIQVTVAAAAALVFLAAAFLGAGAGILGQAASACQAAPPASPAAAAIPAAYLADYQAAGARYGIPWTVLAGIGEAESGHGRSDAPGVHSGANPAGAAGPMQFGIGGIQKNHTPRTKQSREESRKSRAQRISRAIGFTQKVRRLRLAQ